MEDQAASLLATLKKPSAPVDRKLTQFNNLKSSIKHERVPQECTPTIFECVRLAIAAQTSTTLVSTGFSTLGHIIKRLSLQSQTQIVAQQSDQLLPILLDRLGDARESQRNAASQALSDIWPYNHAGVESIVREGALGGTNSRAKEIAMQWVVKMHASDNLPFKSFVPYLVANLEDPDGMVRETAKSAVVELFRNAPDHAKNDLKKKMNSHNVRKTITNYIISNLGLPGATDVDTKPAMVSVPTLPVLPSEARAESVGPESRPPPAETISMEPLYVYGHRELEDMFRDMHQHFEGRESEHNWLPREKAVLKMRRMLKGNAPTDHESVFIAGVLSLRDGILKVANSLRTTHASNGCQLVQELARTLGPAIDPMVEIMLQNFIKMCANTKSIAAQNGNATVDTIFAYATYTNRMMQHVAFACTDKNVQPRQFSAGWLKTLLQKNVSHKSHFEHAGGLDSAINSMKKGLVDANPKVRENFRATYWAFAKMWPDRAEGIMETLDAKAQSLLQKDPNNPNATGGSASGKGPVSKLKSQASRSSLKDTIAAQRKAALAAKKMPERPSSAQANLSPVKPTATDRPAGSLSKSKSKSPERAINDAISTEEVKVYEDPLASESQRPSSDEKPVLEELPVNEQNRDRRVSSGTPEGEHAEEGHKSNGTEEVVQDRAEVLRTRRLLASGIERIRAKTLDAHGFRRLQDVVKGDLDIWGEQDQRFGELLIALLDYLEAPVDTKTPNIKAQNLKTQVLGTIRAMLTLHRKKSGPYYARALCSVLASRSQWDTASHITTDIEKTAEEIVKNGQTSDLITGILEYLDSANTPTSPSSAVSSDQSRPASASPSPRTVTLALQTLSSLLQLSAAKNVAVSDGQAQQLGRLAVKFLGSLDPDVRRADMDFCVQLHERLGGEQDGGFWKAVSGADKGHLNLITYYLARRSKA
ncbi:putative heat repeat containing protein [Diplodia seriata]|uniref:Putative heat repeat containing protein n=1 Tax=Diplodia seriata TaxID=420778 RepID=A0A0G2H2P8_9PEZI|nr:putative heat repeat containing protein [Diplodia seriata]